MEAEVFNDLIGNGSERYLLYRQTRFIYIGEPSRMDDTVNNSLTNHRTPTIGRYI